MKRILLFACLWMSVIVPNFPHFFIVIPTYHNKDYCIENIMSVVNQTYQDWFVYIIVDGPLEEDDGTGDLLENFVREHNLQDKIFIKRNTDRKLAMANHYHAIQECPDEWVVVTLDGDDFLFPTALERIAREYRERDAWMTYGQYCNYPAKTVGVCRNFPQHVIQQNAFRSYAWLSSHPRTMYAWLFKMIRLEDFLYDGKFYAMSCDQAIMLPALEMARNGHIRFIPDVLYAYRHHRLNDCSVNYVLQDNLTKTIRSKQKYPALKRPVVGRLEAVKDAKADIIVFSKDRPLQLYAFLESTQELITGVQTIKVIYHAANPRFAQAYNQVKQAFPAVQFIQQSMDQPKKDFQKLTLDAIKSCKSSYILFAVDDIIVKDQVTISEAIVSLEQAIGYAVYLRLGENTDFCYAENRMQNVPTHVTLNNGMHAWQFNKGSGDWSYPNTVDMTLYRKKDVLNTISRLQFNTPNTLEAVWASHRRSGCSIGLCYPQSKIVNIPLNMVQRDWTVNRNMNLYSPEQLLEKFEQGLKINIKPLMGIINRSAHMEYAPEFISRA